VTARLACSGPAALWLLAGVTWLAAPAAAARGGDDREQDEAEGEGAGRAEEAEAVDEVFTIREQRPADRGSSRVRLEREEVERRAVTSAAELIEQQPSVYAASGRSGRRTIRLRGFDQRGVAVYVDGVPLAMPYSGATDLGKLPVELIERVRLLKGPTSIAHAPGGMGGAVLIETRDPARAPLIAHLAQLDAAGELHTWLAHSLEAGPLAYALAAGVQQSDGYHLSSRFEPVRVGERVIEDGGRLDNSDRFMAHFSAKLRYRLADSQRFWLQTTFLDGVFGVPRHMTDMRPFFRRFTVWQALLVQAGHRWRAGGLQGDEVAYGAFYGNRLDGYDDAGYSSQQGPNAFVSWYHERSLGARLRLSAPLPGRLVGRLWVETRADHHHDRLDRDEPRRSFGRLLTRLVPELEWLASDALGLIGSAQLDVDVPLYASRTAGAGEDEPAAPTRVLCAPMIALRYEPSPAWLLRLSVAGRHRLPTLGERYSATKGFTVANPTLKPERALYTALDVSWQVVAPLRLDLSVFEAEVDDLIMRVWLPETRGLSQQRNVGRARLAGLEAGLVARPWPWLQLQAAYAFLHARTLNADRLDDRIAQIPGHQASLRLLAEPGERWEIGTLLRVVGPQPFDDYSILGLGTLGTFVVWDASLAYQPAPGVRLFCKAGNLLDMNYQTRYGFPDRGLTVWFGYRLSAG
jgi:iron complex outermembrane receptor protein